MPQISLYMNERVYAKVRRSAEIEHLSVSKWVSRTLEQTLSKQWPDDFDDLFGSIGDETFEAPDRLDMAEDVLRESL